jgi:hypothetical protein
VLSYEDRRAITQGYPGISVLRTTTPGSQNAKATA